MMSGLQTIHVAQPAWQSKTHKNNDRFWEYDIVSPAYKCNMTGHYGGDRAYPT